MKLTEVKYGTDHVYFCSRNNIHCYVVTSDPDDGASLIVEQLDNTNYDLTGKVFYTEASNLVVVAAVQSNAVHRGQSEL